MQTSVKKWNLDGWKVEDNESLSDHKYIPFSRGSFEPRKAGLRNLNTAPWNLFRESLDKVERPVIEDDSSLNDLADKFENLVEGALEKAYPKKPASNKRISSWWDHQLEESIPKVRHLRAVTKNWSRDQFLVTMTKNKKPERKTLSHLRESTRSSVQNRSN